MPINFFKLFFLWITVSLSAACESGASSSHNNNAGGLLSPANGYTFSSPQDALKRSAQLQQLGRNEKALELLASAYLTYPQEGAIISAYARLALALGRNDIAAELLPGAIAADGTDWRALSAQGVLYGRGGKLPEALDVFTQAQGISSGDAIVLNNIAVGHLLEGRTDQAVQLLRQALATAATMDRTHADRIRGNLALALAVSGQFAEADQLAGETLPRALHNADPATLRELMGLSARRIAQFNAPSPSHMKEAPAFDPFSR